MRWIQKVSTTPAADLVTEEDVERLNENELSITGVFSEYDGDIYRAFMELALLTDDLVFFKSLNKIHSNSVLFYTIKILILSQYQIKTY